MLLLVVIIEAQDKSSYIEQQPPQTKQYTASNVAEVTKPKEASYIIYYKWGKSFLWIPFLYCVLLQVENTSLLVFW